MAIINHWNILSYSSTKAKVLEANLSPWRYICWSEKLLSTYLVSVLTRIVAKQTLVQISLFNTHLLCQGKYPCTADLLVFLFGLGYFAYVELAKDLLVSSNSNRRSAVQWYFPFLSYVSIVWLRPVLIKILCLCRISNRFTCLFKFKPVKQDVSCNTVILPLMKLS